MVFPSKWQMNTSGNSFLLHSLSHNYATTSQYRSGYFRICCTCKPPFHFTKATSIPLGIRGMFFDRVAVNKIRLTVYIYIYIELLDYGTACYFVHISNKTLSQKAISAQHFWGQFRTNYLFYEKPCNMVYKLTGIPFCINRGEFDCMWPLAPRVWVVGIVVVMKLRHIWTLSPLWQFVNHPGMGFRYDWQQKFPGRVSGAALVRNGDIPTIILDSGWIRFYQVSISPTTTGNIPTP